MKKILCITLALLMALIFSTSAFATSPSSDPSTAVQYSIDPSYIVTIPQTVTAGNNIAIGATNINTEPGMQVVVSISDGLTNGSTTLIRQDAGGNPETPLGGLENVLSAPITLGGTAVSNSTLLAKFTDQSTTNKITDTLSVGAPDTSGKKAGTYKGTLTFIISYENIMEPLGAATPVTPNSDGEYVIMSGTDWLWFAENGPSTANDESSIFKGKTIKLGKDLDMSLYGNTVMANLPEGCTFDGQNHSIKVNINSSNSDELLGLFPFIISCTVKNITLEGSITGTDDLTGMIGGAFAMVDSVKIDSCINKADITMNFASSTSTPVMGGIIGYAVNGNDNCTRPFEVTNCRNEGQITASGSTTNQVIAGGIIGILFSQGDNLIQNCTNTGTVNNNFEMYSAGIICSLAGNLTINSCTNTGKVYIAGADVTSTYPIIDTMLFGDGNQLIVSDCNPNTQNGTFVVSNSNVLIK